MTNISEFCNIFPSAASLDNRCALLRLSKDDVKGCQQTIANLHLLIVVKKGWLDMIVDGIQYRAPAWSQVDFTMEASKCQFIDCSNDLEAMVVTLSNEFIFNTFSNHPPFRPSYVEYKQTHMVTSIHPAFANRLTGWMEELMENMLDKLNVYREQIIVAQIKIIYMQMANYFETIVIPTEQPKDVKSRQSIIFMQLMKALNKYAAREHSVAFYANFLCISQQYLGRVCRNMTGHSAYGVVSRAVTAEIKKMLSQQGMSMQEVASQLNFSDQTVLTKFFKRETGMTPMQYRNRLGQFHS
ncbi:MAG: helix-turn-helix domain-containing protein [Prevotella sp.]|jgi:AraC-like DNA-binding protein